MVKGSWMAVKCSAVIDCSADCNHTLPLITDPPSCSCCIDFFVLPVADHIMLTARLASCIHSTARMILKGVSNKCCQCPFVCQLAMYFEKKNGK